MNINEKDIFRFVFFRDLLPKEKANNIEKNENYQSQISYYKSIKEAINSKVSTGLQSKIASKIPSYKIAKVFYLYPVNYEESDKNFGPLIFAAKSGKESSTLNTSTFLDEDKEFLIRIITFEDTTKIYFFSFTKEILENLSIRILPDEEEFHLKDTTKPLEIDRKITISSIEIRFRDS